MTAYAVQWQAPAEPRLRTDEFATEGEAVAWEAGLRRNGVVCAVVFAVEGSDGPEAVAIAAQGDARADVGTGEGAALAGPQIGEERGRARSPAEVLADDSLWGFIDPHGAKAAQIRKEAGDDA